MSWEHLVSPLEIRLPKSVYTSASAAIAAFYRVSRSPEYARKLKPHGLFNGFSYPANHSVLMAYDFHTTESGECFLVEINTNAAGFLLAATLDLVKKGGDPRDHSALNQLFMSFENELKLFRGSKPAAAHVAITDEQILEQRMLPEFYMYLDFFKSRGWSAELVEASEFKSADLVYNRTTDFYFETDGTQKLRAAYLNKTACFSPQPLEYWLLADKERLVEMGREDFWSGLPATESERAAIQKVLIPTFDKSVIGSEQDIWEQRKSLFFKPKRSHGGKSVYRGESVSRKVFERLMQDDILIQKFVPAQKVPSENAQSPLDNWKFDLRFFVYEDQVQMVAARAYQGQVTNFASEFGGFTFVQF